jgi:hypothetical protein
LRALDSIPEGDATLLDNTLVVWGREMAQTNHRMSPWPSIFAGGARGGLTTGRYLNFDGEPHAKALVSIAQIMGRDINSVGDIDPDSSPLDGPRLSTRGAGRNVFAESCGWKKACRTEFARERARTTCRATLSCSSRHVSGKVREFGDIATYDATCVVFGFTTTAVLWLVLLPACSGSPADSSEASSGMSSDAGGSGPGTASATRAGESAANGTVGGSNAVSVGGAASDSASATAADSQANSMGFRRARRGFECRRELRSAEQRLVLGSRDQRQFRLGSQFRRRLHRVQLGRGGLEYLRALLGTLRALNLAVG